MDTFARGWLRCPAVMAATIWFAYATNLSAATVVSLRVNVSTSQTPVVLDIPYTLDSTNSQLGSSRVQLFSAVTPTGSGSYHYSIGTAGFRGVNAFFHADSMLRFLKRVYPPLAIPMPVVLNVGLPGAQTQAVPGCPPFAIFGEEVPGRHAAQDPGIVAHEVGHTLLFANHIYSGQGGPIQYPGGLLPQREKESISLHEGMATFLAAAYLGTAGIGEYGGTYVQRTDRPASSHRLTNYSALFNGCTAFGQYCIGEIWSGCLWNYYQTAGDSALSVVLRSLKYWPNNDLTFESVADAMRAAALEVGGAHPAAVSAALAAREIGISTPVMRTLGPIALRHQHTGSYLATVDGGLPPYTFEWTKRLRVDEETTLSYLGLSGSPTPDSLQAQGTVPGSGVVTVLAKVTDQRGASWTDSLLVDVLDPWAPPTTGIQVLSADGNFSALPNQLKSFTAPYTSYAGQYNSLPAEWEFRVQGGAWQSLGAGKELQFMSAVSYDLRAHRLGLTSSPATITVAGGVVASIAATPPDYSCQATIALAGSASGGVPPYSFEWSADSDVGAYNLSSYSGPTSGFSVDENVEYVDVRLTVRDAFTSIKQVVRRVPRVGTCGVGGGGDPGDIAFGASRRMQFATPTAGFVEVGAFDVAGRKVAVLLQETLPAGRHALQVPAGISTGRVLFVAIRLDGRITHARRILLLE